VLEGDIYYISNVYNGADGETRTLEGGLSILINQGLSTTKKQK